MSVCPFVYVIVHVKKKQQKHRQISLVFWGFSGSRYILWCTYWGGDWDGKGGGEGRRRRLTTE